MHGLEAYKQFILMYITAFPDARFTIDDIIAEGDTVVVRYTARGTHQGNLMGIPPTGKQASVTTIGIFRIVNGKAVEQWINCDDLGLLQQLGVVPTMV
jgi:predicted ester cyclase